MIIQPVFVADIQRSSSSCLRPVLIPFQVSGRQPAVELKNVAQQPNNEPLGDVILYSDQRRWDSIGFSIFKQLHFCFWLFFFLNNTQPSDCKKMSFCVAEQYRLYDSWAAFYSNFGGNITILLSDKSDFFRFLHLFLIVYILQGKGGACFPSIDLDRCLRFVFIFTLRLIKPADRTIVSTLFAGIFSLGTILKYECTWLQPCGAHNHRAAMFNHDDEPVMARRD